MCEGVWTFVGVSEDNKGVFYAHMTIHGIVIISDAFDALDLKKKKRLLAGMFSKPLTGSEEEERQWEWEERNE